MIVKETPTPPPAGFVASSPFTLRDFAAKAMSVEGGEGRKWYERPSDTAMATVQWRAVLTNETRKTAGCRLKIRLFDEDGFDLTEISYVGEGDTRDFEPGKRTTITGTTLLSLGAVRHLETIRVIATPLPSSAEAAELARLASAELLRRREAERLAELEAKQREDEARRQKQEAERIAAAEEDEARRQKQERDIILAAKLAAAYNKIPNWDLVAAIKEEKVKWDSLYIGMTMQQVEDILGKPEEKSALGWRYSDGSYVSFFMERVQSWGRR